MKLFRLIWRLFSSLFKKPAPEVDLHPDIRSEAQEVFDLYKNRGIMFAIRRHPVKYKFDGLQVGDEVTWVSKSRGKETELKGEVVYVVPAGMHKLDALSNFPDHDHSRAGHGDFREADSYLVEIKNSDRSRPFIYHPRVSALFYYP